MHHFPQNHPDTLWCNLNLRWVYTELLRSINAQTNNFHLSNDLLHDAIVKFAVKSSIENIQEPHAYLRTIIKHTMVDYYRHQAHFVEPSIDVDGAQLYAIEDETSLIYSPERIADIKQRMQVLQNIIECLPAKCREVFWMCRIEGKSQVEISKLMNISLNMVERHMMRALVDLSFAKDYLIKP